MRVHESPNIPFSVLYTRFPQGIATEEWTFWGCIIIIVNNIDFGTGGEASNCGPIAASVMLYIISSRFCDL